MAKKKHQEPHEASLSLEQMESAIKKIDRRIKDIESFDVESVLERFDPRISALSDELDSLLVDVFGSNTIEYGRYCNITQLDKARMILGHQIPIEEVRVGLVRGISQANVTLQTIKKGFLEEIEDGKDSDGQTILKAYDGLELHYAINDASSQLFRDGHYANAVEDAIKALNAFVMMRSGVDDKDGSKLMEFVFSPSKPILKMNDLKDQSSKKS